MYIYTLIYIYIYIYIYLSWVRTRVRVRSCVRETRVRETRVRERAFANALRSDCVRVIRMRVRARSGDTYARSGAFGYNLSGFATALSQPTSLLPIVVAGGCFGCFLRCGRVLRPVAIVIMMSSSPSSPRLLCLPSVLQLCAIGIS